MYRSTRKFLPMETQMKRREVLRAARRPRRAGFTLIELLLVLVILAILSTVVVVKFVNRPEQARQATAKTSIKNLNQVIEIYKNDIGKYPDKLDDLVVKPGDVSNWNGPYVQGGVPKDPWKHDFVYRNPGQHNQNGIDLFSCGPDGQEGGGDDIDNWSPE